MAPRCKSKTVSIAILISVYLALLTGPLSQRGVNAQLNCGCSSTYTPVCAGGKTYNNACLAKCDGRDPSTPGACDAPKPAPPPRKDCSSTICPALYDPVCGEDNVTYDNTCLASCAGVAVKDRGECGSTHPPESPDSPVSAVPNACTCPADNKPVCGSDGNTYSSVCNMQCLSPDVTVDYIGRCADPTGCSSVQCTTAYFPVCGANGRTYPNRCIAACTGVTVVSSGVCNPSQCECPPNVNQPVCGRDGKTYNSSCQAAFCAGVGVAYGGACEEDDSGCAAVVCPAIYAPVCGTDNRTYANACLASCAGVTIARRSACEELAARVPLNINNGSLCICTREYRPVCGTNGRTYGNPCQAIKCANVSIAYEGACENTVCNKAQCSTEYDPICGLNGREYTNICTADCYGISFQPGVCRPVASPNPPRPSRPQRPPAPPRPSPPPRPPSPPPPKPRPPKRPSSPRPPRPPPRKVSPSPLPSPSPVSSPPRKLSPSPAVGPSPGAILPPASSPTLVPNQLPLSPVSSAPPVTSASPPPPIPGDDMEMAPVEPILDPSPGSGSSTDSGFGIGPDPGSTPVPRSDPEPEADPAQENCSNCDNNYVKFVCGANGLTYQNICFAECMGVKVVENRRCPTGGASRNSG
ncbi:hypothetical protein Vafri_5192 [Volvox africanus]|uniref:Kazal-like domain-containing protein n=1 Tax=Volvox africanus TaxID=51714 RepID=A0A8J4AZL8_9CHLO|nr:hypothetical protein Vafri_5192 [Volvox africanus]